jgi:hypothetical protein
MDTCNLCLFDKLFSELANSAFVEGNVKGNVKILLLYILPPFVRIGINGNKIAFNM